MGKTADDILDLDQRNLAGLRLPAFSDPWIVAGLALGVGVAIDTVALHQPPGIGLALGLWIGLIVAASVGHLMDAPKPPAAAGFTVVGFVLAAFVGVRASPVLITLNVGAALLLVAVISQLRRRGDLARWTLASYGAHPAILFGDALSGAAGFVGTDLRAGVAPERRRRVGAIAIGMVIGVPISAVFVLLFASADVSFDAYLREFASSFTATGLASRTFWAFAMALVVAGFWRTARRGAEPVVARPRRKGAPHLDPAAAVTVLVLLVVLFAMFLLTQVFGRNPDLVTPQDYSRNARGGFFQLFTVAALVLTFLLAFDWLTRTPAGARSKSFDRLALVLVMLTVIVMISAMSRMRLYVNEFGLTELRLYTSVFMVWLGFVLAWLVATVLRNRHARFALGVLVSGLLMIVALNVANPDAMIVRFNWDRHLAGQEFAEDYTATLSADSIPELVQIVEGHPDEQFCYVERRLNRERAALHADRIANGLLGDSWSQYRARGALGSPDFALGDGC